MPQALIDPSTSPEEILALPNVAVISDEVESLDELVNSLMRYLKLPRRDRRLSDYCSVEMYGCNVTDMFMTMRYRFKMDVPLPFKETLLFSEPDLYYNKKAFDEGKINLCFVIGYSGSGKSVLTRDYEGESLEKVELDSLVCVKDHFTLDELRVKSEMMFSFLTGEGSKYYITREERDLFENHSELFVNFINYARGYAAEHPEKKYILEGIWTYLFFDDPAEFDQYAVFMKGTSLAKSKIRRLKREASDSAEEAIERIMEFGIYATDSAFHDGNVDKWRRYFEKKTETVIRQEDSRFKTLRGEIMSDVNRINRYFVLGDEDGIRAIMNNALSRTDIDVREQAFVAEECKRALADLGEGSLRTSLS